MAVRLMVRQPGDIPVSYLVHEKTWKLMLTNDSSHPFYVRGKCNAQVIQ